MGGGGGETVTKTEPWEGQKPYLEGIYKLAQDAYNQTSKSPYTGNLVAGLDPNQTQARSGMANLATQLAGSTMGQDVQKLAQDQINGAYLRPESNPFLTGAINAAVNPIQERYQTQIMPQLHSQAVNSGAYGGARANEVNHQAAGNFAREALDSTAKITYQNYAQERALQQAAPQLYQAGTAISQAPLQMLESIGQLNRTAAQDALDQAYQQWQMQQQAPWLGLSELAGVVQNGSPGSSTSQLNPRANGFMGALSGAAGGAMMGTQILPGIGTGIGGLLGLAGGLFGR